MSSFHSVSVSETTKVRENAIGQKLLRWVIAGVSPPITHFPSDLEFMLATLLQSTWLLEVNNPHEFPPPQHVVIGNDWYDDGSGDCQIHANFLDMNTGIRSTGYGALTEYIYKIDLHFFVKTDQPRFKLTDIRMQLMVDEVERILTQYTGDSIPGVVYLTFSDSKDIPDQSNLATLKHRVMTTQLVYFKQLV